MASFKIQTFSSQGEAKNPGKKTPHCTQHLAFANTTLRGDLKGDCEADGGLNIPHKNTYMAANGFKH